MVRRAILVLALAAVTAGCGGGGGEKQASSSLFIQLQEQSSSGQSGSATLTADGDRTRVVIELSTYTATPQPAHIHSGTCSSLDPTPAYPLRDVVRGKSTTVVNVSLDSLREKPYAINVHRSAKEMKTYAACGEIREHAAPAPTYTTSDEDDY